MCVRTEGGAGGVLTGGAVLLQDGLVQGAAQDVPLQRDNVGYRQGLPATLPRTGGPAGPADTWRCPRCSDSPARHCSLSCRRGTRGNSEAAAEARHQAGHSPLRLRCGERRSRGHWSTSECHRTLLSTSCGETDLTTRARMIHVAHVRYEYDLPGPGVLITTSMLSVHMIAKLNT